MPPDSRVHRPVEVLWCPNNRHGRKNGWSFPPRVRRLLLEITADKTVLQLFGGMADFGVRLDIDPVTMPHVLGDAWLPPFKRDAFDVVIIDPPYSRMNQQMKRQLLQAATYIARDYLIWFHTQWIASDRFARFERGWLVRVGDSCSVRCIQLLRTCDDKPAPQPFFERGPAIRYNHWLGPQVPFSFDYNLRAGDPKVVNLMKHQSREPEPKRKRKSRG